MSDSQELKRRLVEYYSKNIPIEQLQNLASIQKQYLSRYKKQKLLIVPAMVAICMGMILMNNVYRLDTRFGADADLMNYLSEHMSDNDPMPALSVKPESSKTADLNALISIGRTTPQIGNSFYWESATPILQNVTLQNDGRTAQRYSLNYENRNDLNLFDDSSIHISGIPNTEFPNLTEKINDAKRWDIVHQNSYAIKNGATAKHYRVVNRHNGHIFKLVVFENMPETEKFVHPLHMFKDGMNIRIWRENEYIVTIAGSIFDEEELSDLARELN